MKITDVDAIHLRVESQDQELFDGSYDDCVIVVHTDEGVSGLGEVESLTPAVQAFINGPSAHSRARALKEVLIGRDPTSPQELWELMYEGMEYVGRRGLGLHALGGVDLALWDIKSKVEGKPVHEVLGMKRHSRIPAYATIYPMERTSDGVRRQIESAKDRNLRAFKLSADPWWMEDLSNTTKLLQAARYAAGAQAHLVVDAALAFRTADEVLRLLPILREIGIWFLESPLPLDDVDGHARLAGKGVPIGVEISA